MPSIRHQVLFWWPQQLLHVGVVLPSKRLFSPANESGKPTWAMQDWTNDTSGGQRLSSVPADSEASEQTSISSGKQLRRHPSLKITETDFLNWPE